MENEAEGGKPGEVLSVQSHGCKADEREPCKRIK